MLSMFLWTLRRRVSEVVEALNRVAFFFLLMATCVSIVTYKLRVLRSVGARDRTF